MKKAPHIFAGCTLAALAFLVVLASCESTPPVPVRKTSDDCLVLIRTVTANDTYIGTARQYRLQFSEGHPELSIPDEPESFVYVMLREAGAKIIGLKSTVGGYNVTGQGFDEPLDIDLPYKPGELVVADFTFTRSQKKQDANTIISDFDFQQTSEEGKASVVAQFKELQWSRSWLD